MIYFIHIPKTGGTSIKGTLNTNVHGHAPMSRMANRSLVYFSCTRNPYDRACSIYYHRKNIAQKVLGVAGQVPNRHPMWLAGDSADVNEYWRRVYNGEGDADDGMLKTQMHFLRDNPNEGGISTCIKELIRFETFSQDWPLFAAKHGLKALEHKNKSKLRPSQPWNEELDDESIKAIGELYADDFEHLGYERL